jgi:methyl-accepting chemotaxis protein
VGAFVLVSIITAVVGLVGYRSITEADEHVANIGKVRLPSVYGLEIINEAKTSTAVGLLGLLNTRVWEVAELNQAYTKKIQDSLQRAEEGRKIFEPLEQTDEEKTLWKDFDSKWRIYVNALEKVTDLMEDKRQANRDGSQNDERLAALDARIFEAYMKEYRPAFYEAEESLSKVIELNEKLGEKMVEEAEAAGTSAKSLMVMAIAVGVVLAVVLGFVLSRSIAIPLGKTVTMIQELGQGHLKARLDMDRGDEIGVMAKAMDQFADDLQRNVVGSMQRIAVGDVNIQLTPKDAQDEITPALKATIEAIQGLVAEARMLTGAAIEGKLATRGNTDKFQGGYRQVIQGVNDTLNAVIGPLNVAGEYIDRIAKGDVPHKITDSYTGDFNEIKNNLNACIDAVNLLVADANLLSRAAVEGKLATRADASRHQGDFRKIVQGVNETLDAVIGPVNEASEILRKMAACDFAARMKGDYRGDHALIKNNLNEGMESVQRVIRDVSDIVAKFAAGDLTVKASEGDYRGDVVQLARNLNGSIEALKNVIMRIRQTSISVASAADQISTNTDQITKGAQSQASAADETSASMEEMSVSIQGVARIAEGLASNVDETTSSIQQMGTTAEGVSRNAETMASNVSETSSTIEQMVVTLEKTAKNVDQADRLSQQASTEAQDGGDAVLKTVNGMRNISDTMENISAVIQNLGQRSEAIGNIVEVIEEIADQTNLLALNAAIEAARAGDAGRGFAVVADEVRKLAERSIKATKEIGEVIKQVQKDTASAVTATEGGAKVSRDGIALADQAGAAIKRIMEAVRSSSDIMRDIALATNEQSIAAKNVIRAVEEMNRLTQAVTQSTREQASGVGQVVKASEDMAQLTEKVKNATAEQKRGGENVVKAVENIRDIAKSNLVSVEQLAGSAKDLARQSEGLQELVQAFRVS